MAKQKNNSKGVTLISLVIIILIMLILSTTIGYNVLNRNQMEELDDLYNDLTLLEEKYKSYYIQNGTVPLGNKYANTNEVLEKIKDVRNPNDNNEYYYVSTSQNSGTFNVTGDVKLKTKGTFVINEKTLTIYYLDGIEVEGKKYYTLPREYSEVSVEENFSNILNGSWNEAKKVNSPQLLEGMTPVYWDENGNEQVLNKNNQNDLDKWYDYYANKWANAKTKDGSYWVWIPRYEYKIKNPGTAEASEIYIKFIKTSQTTPDADYDYIHPAFTNGKENDFKNGEWDEEIPGFWVSKYLAGYQASTIDSNDILINGEDTVTYSNYNYTSFYPSFTTNALGQNLTEANYATQKISYPVFKPLTYAYNVIGIGDCYTISQNIAKANQFYGLNPLTTDSHLSKNSEYGAIVYLAHSTFGVNNAIITENTKNINDTTKHIYGVTGYAGATPLGVSASSTNNITGVFDLNGCANEHTAAYIANGESALKEGKSFTEFNEQTGLYRKESTKYATVYKIGNIDTSEENYKIYKNVLTTEKYGDAILETSNYETNELVSWQRGNAVKYPYPNTTAPFFARVGNRIGNSVFTICSASGAPYDSTSFRTILIGTKDSNINIQDTTSNKVTISKTPSGSNWTSEDVIITLSHNNIPEGYVIQYKVGNGNWTNGMSLRISENNTTIYGRLYNEILGAETAVNSITITNIDKTAPTAPTGIESSATSNSITVKASGGTDKESGVAGYQYRINGGAWSGTIDIGTSHTFSGLTAVTNYTIEARTIDNVGRTSTVYTKVIQLGSIKVTGITLANKTLTKTGTTNPTVTITPTITPSNATNKGVTWSSSNPEVATVNASGVATYVGVGTTTITATAQDGSGVKGTCTVTCTENIKVTGITIANQTISTTNPTVTITPTITPSNATNKGVTWSSSNTGVATVDASGVVTYVSAGTTTITATAKDGSGVKGTCTIICAETTGYWGRLYNGECAEYGTTKYKTWNIDLTAVSNIQFELWAGGNAYYWWRVWTHLIINGQTIYSTGIDSAGKTDGMLIGNANWDVKNYSGNATIQMSVYGRSVKGDPNPYYMWGEIRNMIVQ